MRAPLSLSVLVLGVVGTDRMSGHKQVSGSDRTARRTDGATIKQIAITSSPHYRLHLRRILHFHPFVCPPAAPRSLIYSVVLLSFAT